MVPMYTESMHIIQRAYTLYREQAHYAESMHIIWRGYTLYREHAHYIESMHIILVEIF